jgi:hypothetical protein
MAPQQPHPLQLASGDTDTASLVVKVGHSRTARSNGPCRRCGTPPPSRAIGVRRLDKYTPRLRRLLRLEGISSSPAQTIHNLTTTRSRTVLAPPSPVAADTGICAPSKSVCANSVETRARFSGMSALFTRIPAGGGFLSNDRAVLRSSSASPGCAARSRGSSSSRKSMRNSSSLCALDVPQEIVAQSFSFGRALDDPRDIGDGQWCGSRIELAPRPDWVETVVKRIIRDLRAGPRWPRARKVDLPALGRPTRPDLRDCSFNSSGYSPSSPGSPRSAKLAESAWFVEGDEARALPLPPRPPRAAHVAAGPVLEPVHNEHLVPFPSLRTPPSPTGTRISVVFGACLARGGF